MSLAIAVEKAHVRLTGMDQTTYEAKLFLHTVSEHDFRHETVGDRLNNPETAFLPFEVDAEVRLVALSSLSHVEQLDAPLDVERLDEIGALHQTVCLRLVSGDLLRGDLIYEGGATQARVSDILNDPARRFLVLVGENRVLFVRSGAIEWVEV